MRNVVRSLLLSSVWFLAGCASYGTPLPDIAEEVNATMRPPRVLLGPGDTLEIEWPAQPALTQTVQIRLDGKTSLHEIGEIAVAGLSIEGLYSRVRAAHNVSPGAKVEFTINLVGRGSSAGEAAGGTTAVPEGSIVVMGEVNSPGEVAMGTNGRLTLIEALGRAGGPLKETALLQHLLLVRWLPDEGRQIAWRIDARVKYWGAALPIMLQKHDIVFVPNTPIDDVDIWVDQYIRRLLPFPYLPVSG
jgi:protein involved in polysaccharide export with SLBB domain